MGIGFQSYITKTSCLKYMLVHSPQKSAHSLVFCFCDREFAVGFQPFLAQDTRSSWLRVGLSTQEAGQTNISAGWKGYFGPPKWPKHWGDLDLFHKLPRNMWFGNNFGIKIWTRRSRNTEEFCFIQTLVWSMKKSFGSSQILATHYLHGLSDIQYSWTNGLVCKHQVDETKTTCSHKESRSSWRVNLRHSIHQESAHCILLLWHFRESGCVCLTPLLRRRLMWQLSCPVPRYTCKNEHRIWK